MTTSTHVEGGAHVLKTPLWLAAIRGFILLLSVIILGLAAALIHGAYLDVWGLAVATAILTWITVGYIIVAEKMPSAHGLYHVIAVIALDSFMVVMWLATWAANAAFRAAFTTSVNVDQCYNDGSLTKSNFCSVWKRSMEKRSVILFKTGQDIMAAVAGLGALVWILFLICLVWESIQFHRGRKDGRFTLGTSTNEHQMQNQTPGGPVMAGPGPEKTGVYQQQVPVQHNGQYQTPVVAGQYPVQGQVSPQGYGSSYNGYPSPVSPPPASTSPYQAPYPPPQNQVPVQHPQHSELPQQPYSQVPPQEVPASEFQYPQYGNHSELDGQQPQQHAQYPQAASPPPPAQQSNQ